MLVVVVSEPDPVAVRVAERWGTPPSTGEHVEGAAFRTLAPDVVMLRRAARHIHDERLDARFPASIRAHRPTIVFPSIHRSEQNVACLTVHPLGNPGPAARFGGRPRTLVPTDARRMTAALRALNEASDVAGLAPTFEATHHGPELGLPAFFMEIGFGTASAPSEAAVRELARTIPAIAPDVADRIVVGIGGGHYAPHFTELALKRRWSFAHIVSRHALGELDRSTAGGILAASDGAEGMLFARAQDAEHPALEGLAARLRDADAPSRGAGSDGGATRAARPSGT